jgi:hypothetical protein
MAADDSGDVFKVTDRRRRPEADDDDAPQPAASQDEAPPTPAPPGPPTERSLAGLFMMLASSAVVALGHAPDPLTGQRQIDLVQAADAIDLLLLLREKTERHRSDGESQMLEELIYDLQLRYVQVTKQS